MFFIMSAQMFTQPVYVYALIICYVFIQQSTDKLYYGSVYCSCVSKHKRSVNRLHIRVCNKEESSYNDPIIDMFALHSFIQGLPCLVSLIKTTNFSLPKIDNYWAVFTKSAYFISFMYHAYLNLIPTNHCESSDMGS